VGVDASLASKGSTSPEANVNATFDVALHGVATASVLDPRHLQPTRDGGGLP
jgi:hypothetical protein